MIRDGQKLWTDIQTDRMDGHTHGRRQNYILLTLLGDNTSVIAGRSISQKNNKKVHA